MTENTGAPLSSNVAMTKARQSMMPHRTGQRGVKIMLPVFRWDMRSVMSFPIEENDPAHGYPRENTSPLNFEMTDLESMIQAWSGQGEIKTSEILGSMGCEAFRRLGPADDNRTMQNGWHPRVMNSPQCSPITTDLKFYGLCQLPSSVLEFPAVLWDSWKRPTA
jgi:hypothetical protein